MLALKWRQKEKLKTTAVALVLCLNIGVDPPDVIKISPCARLECWVDPMSMQPAKALETIGGRGRMHAPCKHGVDPRPMLTQARTCRRSTSAGSLAPSTRCTSTRPWTTSRSCARRAGSPQRSVGVLQGSLQGHRDEETPTLSRVDPSRRRTSASCSTTTATACHGRRPTGRSGSSIAG